MDRLDPILADYYSTIIYSDPNGYEAKNVENSFSDIKVIFITRDNKISFGSQYIASPFFNDKEIMIRDKMVTHFDKYFRPDQTETSKKFDNDHSEELSKLVFQDNLNEIFTTTSMCFPMYTDDLGTLFEVGVCRRLGHPLFRYEYEKDLVTLLDFEDKELSIISCNKPTPIIDCSNLAGAVLVGYNYDHETLCYKIGKLNDNLMLSTTFRRVEKDSTGKYKIMPKKMAEIR
jgi:nucleoside 2-deoxyribosyltransferase